MPKPEINDFYLQLLQLKAQTSKLTYELLLQKQSWWQKNYGSIVAVISIVSSYFVANKISAWSYKNQRRLEEEKRNEEKTKISQDNFKRIYSELSSMMFEFVNKSTLSDFEKIHFEYYKSLSYAAKSILRHHEGRFNVISKCFNTSHPTFELHHPF